MYALASRGAPPLLRGRRGTMCTAKGSDVRSGVPWGSAAFAWQAWDNVHCQGVRCTPWRPLGAPSLLRGRRGTMCIAKGSDVRPGVPWGSASFAWQAWASAAFAWQAWENVHCQGVRYTPWQAWNMYLLTHSLTNSLTHSSLTHALTHSLIHSLTHSLIHSFTHSLTHSRTHSLTHLLNPSTHSLTHSLPPSLTHSLTVLEHTYTHTLTYLPTYIPTYIPTIVPPSLSYFLFPSRFLCSV